MNENMKFACVLFFFYCSWVLGIWHNKMKNNCKCGNVAINTNLIITSFLFRGKSMIFYSVAKLLWHERYIFGCIPWETETVLPLVLEKYSAIEKFVEAELGVSPQKLAVPHLMLFGRVCRFEATISSYQYRTGMVRHGRPSYRQLRGVAYEPTLVFQIADLASVDLSNCM